MENEKEGVSDQPTVLEENTDCGILCPTVPHDSSERDSYPTVTES